MSSSPFNQTQAPLHGSGCQNLSVLKMKPTIITWFVVILVSCIKTGRASIITRPKPSETPLGELAYFNCSTTKTTEAIQWFHYPDPNSERKLVYGFEQFHDGYREFRMDIVSSTGSWNLVIPSVAIENAGKYECQDDIGRGEKSSADLIILGSTEFQSRTETRNVIGKNTCGIEPNHLVLSCNVRYYGSAAPNLEWRRTGDSNPISEGVTHESLPNKSIIYNLNLKGDSIESGSSYTCFGKISNSAIANCKSGNITVVGNVVDTCMWKCDSCQRYITAIICIFLIIIPFLNALAAGILWYLFLRRQKETLYCQKQEKSSKGPSPRFKVNISKEATIFVLLMAIPFYVGLGLLLRIYFRRRKLANDRGLSRFTAKKDAEKSPLNIPIAESQPEENDRESLAIEEDETNRRERNSEQDDTIASLENKVMQKENTIAEMRKRLKEFQKEIQILKESSKRKDDAIKQLELYLYPPDIIEYDEKPSLVHKIKSNSAKGESKSIHGLAVLGNELFVLLNSAEIEVYDSVTYNYERKLQISIIENPFDLTSGKADNCLFIIGLEKNGATVDKDHPEGLIGKIDANGRSIKPWPKPSGGHSGSLSTCESNLIVCLLEKTIINEFSTGGDLIRTVRLSPAVGFKNPLHAIKVSGMHYAVSHGYENGEVHRICVVDLDGNIVKECRAWKRNFITKHFTERKFKTPIHFIDDAERSLLVADRDHHRILLFNSALKYQRKLIELENERLPMRVCFDTTESRLFVATNKGNVSKGHKDVAVLIYNIK